MESHQTVLSREQKQTFAGCYYTYFVSGAMALILGALLPFLKEFYGISYQFSGLLVSVHSVGNLFAIFVAGILPIYLGRSKSILLLATGGPVAFFLISFSGSPYLLFLAFFLTGVSRGAVNNFNNTMINEIAPGKTWALSLLHASFSLGSFLGPFIVLICTRNDSSKWIYAALVLSAMLISELFVLFFMKIPNNHTQKRGPGKIDFSFLKNRFILTACGILFFYLCAEQAIIGWLVTYLKDSGIMSQHFSQVMAGLLGIAILLGRLFTAYVTKFMKSYLFLLCICFCYAAFFLLLLFSRSSDLVSIGIVGIGFFMGGIYPTTLSGIGSVVKQYPAAMSFILTFASIGAIIMPSIVGTVAEHVGIIGGMSVVIVAVGINLVFVIYNALIFHKQEI